MEIPELSYKGWYDAKGLLYSLALKTCFAFITQYSI